MRYTHYYEAVEREGDKYVAEAKYTFNGKTFEDFAEVDTVSQAHAKLREFRAEFREFLRVGVGDPERIREDVERDALEGTTI